MGLVNGEKKLTDCSISQKIDNQKIDKKTYCFGSNGAKEAFMKDPEANIAKAQETFAGGNEPHYSLSQGPLRRSGSLSLHKP